MVYSHETKSKLGSWVQNILPVSIAAEVTRTTNSLELSWCILQLCFQPQNIPQKQCPRKCCCSLSIMFPRGKCWVIEYKEDGEKLLFQFGDSFGCISFLIISYVFTYILLKHLEAFGSRCPGTEKKIKMKLKIPSRIRIAAFCMWIVLRLKPRLSLITPLSLTSLSPPAPPKIHKLVFSLAHHPSPLSWWLLPSPASLCPMPQLWVVRQHKP